MSTKNTTATTKQPSRAAYRAVSAILGVMTWAVGLRREVKAYSLTGDECDAAGVPLGSVEPCAWALPLSGSPWWSLDLWDDGDCVHARVLGWALEVHYEAQRGATEPA